MGKNKTYVYLPFMSIKGVYNNVYKNARTRDVYYTLATAYVACNGRGVYEPMAAIRLVLVSWPGQLGVPVGLVKMVLPSGLQALLSGTETKKNKDRLKVAKKTRNEHTEKRRLEYRIQLFDICFFVIQ